MPKTRTKTIRGATSIVHAGDQRRDYALSELSKDIGPCLYAVNLDDCIKIGYSANIVRRLGDYGALQRVLAILPGTLADEKAMHARLKPFIHHGKEHYRICQPVIDVVNEMRAHLGHYLPPLTLTPPSPSDTV